MEIGEQVSVLGSKKIEPSNVIGRRGRSLREVFGQSLVDLGKENQNFVVLDADVAGGTGTHHFRSAYPNRFYQFGIAEQNMFGAAGGISITGIVPVVTTFAVFALRALEQIRLSICYCDRNVKIFASHPGLDAGPDGASAQSLEDIACFRSLPKLTVISPADPIEMEQVTRSVLHHVGPVYVRTGRSPAQRVVPSNYEFRIGKGVILKDGNDVTLVACGIQVGRALQAAEILHDENISARVINMPTIKPIDSELLLDSAAVTGCFVTSEDHSVIGGLGSAISEFLMKHCPVPLEFNGVNDVFGESGDPEDLAQKYGLTAFHIAAKARLVLERKRG